MPVGRPNRRFNGTFDLRLSVEPAGDAVGGAIEHGAHVDVGIGLCIRALTDGARLRQKVGSEEIVDGVGGGGFSIGAVFFDDGRVAFPLCLRLGLYRAIARLGGSVFGGDGAIAFLGRTVLGRNSAITFGALLDLGLAGSYFGALGSHRLHRTGDDSGYQHNEYGGDSDHQRAMASREFLKLISRRWRAGRAGLVGE